jgi:hypothetical protein
MSPPSEPSLGRFSMLTPKMPLALAAAATLAASVLVGVWTPWPGDQ